MIVIANGRRSVSGMLLGLIAMLVVQGCMGRYALDRKPVKQISEAERKARGRAAFERARERVREVKVGMSPPEVQAAMGAVIAIEEGAKGGQRKLMEGFLCKLSAGALRERWLFGYDEGNVELVGFAVEFVRSEADEEDWTAKRVDSAPEDDCPVVGDTQLD